MWPVWAAVFRDQGRESPMSETERHYDTRFPGDRRLRVGDRDREAVADILRREHVAGRIDSEEFEERVTRCLAAKTYADLDALIRDFPADERAAPQRGRRLTAVGVFPFFPVVPIVVAAIIFSHGHLLWLVFPAFFFLVVRPFLWGRFGGGWGPRRMVFAAPRHAHHYA